MSRAAGFTSRLLIDHKAEGPGNVDALLTMANLCLDFHKLKTPHRVGSGGRRAVVSDQPFPAASRRGLKTSGKNPRRIES